MIIFWNDVDEQLWRESILAFFHSIAGLSSNQFFRGRAAFGQHPIAEFQLRTTHIAENGKTV